MSADESGGITAAEAYTDCAAEARDLYPGAFFPFSELDTPLSQQVYTDNRRFVYGLYQEFISELLQV